MKVEIYRFDDWEMLYIDGKLNQEAHSIPVRDVLEACGIEVHSDYLVMPDEAIRYGWVTPKDSKDIPSAVDSAKVEGKKIREKWGEHG